MTRSRTALVAGATGLVGREIVRGLLADETVATVHALVRREGRERNPRLAYHVVDFALLPRLPRVDEVYLALGTTIAQAGSQEAFRAVDFDATLAVARAAMDAGATFAGLVSAMGANPRSRVFYSRVKGEVEEALAALGFAGLVIARPSLLLGDRQALGQSPRPGERIGTMLDRLIGGVLPGDYRAIAAADVARALMARVPTATGVEVLSSGAMRHRH